MAETRLSWYVEVVVHEGKGEKVKEVNKEVREEEGTEKIVARDDALQDGRVDWLHTFHRLDHPLRHDVQINFVAIEQDLDFDKAEAQRHRLRKGGLHCT